jgi:thiol:disulfide interchange protein DsbC
MTIPISKTLLAIFLASAAHPALSGSDEGDVLAAVRQAYPGTKVDRAERTPMPGVYEVWMGGNVAFVSAGEPRYMVFGRLVDLKTMQDLTAAKLRDAQAVVAPLIGPPGERDAYTGPMPTADAITAVRGDGRRVISVFTDPACAFCRQLESQLQQLTDVTIHYYLLPFQGEEMPMAIWCAKDRQAAYRTAMTGMAPPTVTQTNCRHPLDRNRLFAASLRVQATPTLLFEDGSLVAGVMTVNEIESRLNAGGINAVRNGGENHASPMVE